MKSPPTTPWQLPRGWCTSVILLTLLVYHFIARDFHAQHLPLAEHHNYERSYGYALSLLAGRGFEDIVLGEQSSTLPIREFLELKRPSVANDEWAAFLAQESDPESDPTCRIWSQLATTRVLDLQLTATLWRIFGIRWEVLYRFYALASVCVALCVFLLTRRISGSNVAGLIATAMFTFAPLESHLAAWSIRDVSPLWFTALGFTFLYCVVDRLKASRWWYVACAVLGVIPILGTGWRPDSLLLVPVLAVAFVVQNWVSRKGWRMSAVGLLLFGLGLVTARLSLSAMTPPNPMPSSMGFHMAYYADFTRCNLWGVENTFQTQRCDIQTLFTARRFAAERSTGESPTLPYLSAEYAATCRDMSLRQMSYHAYELIAGFPRLYFRVLNGLRSPEAFATVDFWQQNEYRLPLLRGLHRWILNPLLRLTPGFFLIGAVVGLCLPSRRWPVAALFGFTLFYALLLILVLPEQKHLGPIQFPLYVLAGSGVWWVGCLVASARREAVQVWMRAGSWRKPALVAISGAAMWGVACGVGYAWGRIQRQALIAEIENLETNSRPAPETLRGEHAFCIHIAPGEPDQRGYLLTIEGGESDSTLTCRHQRFPNDWGWSRQLTTQHNITANCAQTFFVTCQQNGAFADPRPYACYVQLDGTARITDCRQVDLAAWQDLPVSTVFRANERQAGSPRGHEPSSTFAYTSFHVLPEDSIDPLVHAQHEREAYKTPKPVVKLGPPVAHLAFRDSVTGLWVLANSDGRRFLTRRLNYWTPTTKLENVQVGDFSGDGLQQMIARDPETNKWYRIASDGSLISYSVLADWTGGHKVCDLLVGDFNGDGRDDLAGHDAVTREWIVGLSQGRQSVPAQPDSSTLAKLEALEQQRLNAEHSPPVTLEAGGQQLRVQDAGMFGLQESVMLDLPKPASAFWIGDYNGDGHPDIAIQTSEQGELWVGISASGRLTFHKWGDLQSENKLVDGQVLYFWPRAKK